MFDFLICYKTIRYALFNQETTTEAAFILTEGTIPAGTALTTKGGGKILTTGASFTTGPTMYNAYVIQGIATKSYASFVNYYADPDASSPIYGTGLYFATYLRVHASFSITDITSTVSQVAIFLDGYPALSVASSNEKTYESLKKYASDTGDVPLVNHASGSQVVGTVFKGFDEGTVYDATAGTDTYRYLNDLWYSKSGFRYSTTF